jgi:hypothetical protein
LYPSHVGGGGVQAPLLLGGVKVCVTLEGHPPHSNPAQDNVKISVLLTPPLPLSCPGSGT